MVEYACLRSTSVEAVTAGEFHKRASVLIGDALLGVTYAPYTRPAVAIIQTNRELTNEETQAIGAMVSNWLPELDT